MTAVQRFILCYGSDKDEAAAIAAGTAKDLEDRKTTLIEVVQSLGDFINDEDPTKRDRATEFLSQVVAAASTSFLSRQQVAVLNQFFCDRVEDPSTLSGMKSLINMENYNGELATMTFRAVIEHFKDLQTKPQSQRMRVYNLVSELLATHREALKSMGEQSISGVTNLVANEKDPRSLMLVFSILRVIITEWDIEDQAEVLFDAVFCYFPITFRPPPDDPYRITAQDLKNRLRQCISASGHFAPYSLPQLLEKLDSTSANVKRDVMQTIRSCVMSYGVRTVSNYAATLFDSLQYEIWNAQEEDLAEEALSALQSIAIRLGQGLDSTDGKTPLASYLRPITKECNERLQEPQHKQAKVAGQLLSNLGISSPVAFFLIIKNSFPPLSTLYQAADTIAKQRALLEVLLLLLDSAIATYGTLNLQAPETNIENPLVPFKDRMFELTSQALMSSAIDEISFRMTALKALLKLCLIRDYLEENEVGLVVQYLDEIVLTEDALGRDDLKKEAITALVELARVKPHLIMSITFPAFMARLPDSSPTESHDYTLTLEGLAQLSIDRFVADTLIRRLLNRLDVVLKSPGSSTYPQAILCTLHYVLARRDLSTDPNLQFYLEKIVIGLTELTVKSCIGVASCPALREIPIIEMVARLTTLVIRALDSHKQYSIGSQCYSLFIDDGTFTPIPFRQDVAFQEKSTLILSTGVMGAIGPKVKPQFSAENTDSFPSLLNELVRMSITEVDPAIRRSILRQLGLLVNKFAVPAEVGQAESILLNLFSSLSETTTHTEATVRTIMWISKGLVWRLAAVQSALSRVLSLLEDKTCGQLVSRGFGLLLAPDEILSKDNGATIRPLAKQKVFNTCMPVIAEKFQKADASVKPNYLVAMSGLLKYMPTQIIVQEIDSLLPLLLQSLQLVDAEVRAATIQALAVIIQESPAAVEGHVRSLVVRLLDSTSNPEKHAYNVRSQALSCLAFFPSRIKETALLPYRGIVIRGLSAALDDPKRDIRKKAVDCRTAWLNLDEPQSD